MDLIGTLMKGSAPTYTPADISGAPAKATGINQANLPAAEQLASGVNVFNQEQVLKMLNMAIPDYSKIMAASEGVINAQLSGGWLPGEKAALQDLGASVAARSGAAGSQFGAFSTLGLGYAALEQRANAGISNAQSWLKTADALTKAPVFDVTKMFLSPMDVANFDATQHELQYESQLMKWMQPNALQQAGRTLAGVGGTVAGSGILNGFGQTPQTQNNGMYLPQAQQNNFMAEFYGQTGTTGAAIPSVAASVPDYSVGSGFAPGSF